MANDMTRKAAKLGISESYLHKIYHGKAKPGYKFAVAFAELTGKRKPLEWWKTAEVNAIQAAINSI